MVIPCHLNCWEYPWSLGRGSCLHSRYWCNVGFSPQPFSFERLVAFLSSRLSTSFRALWNQALTTIKFCNPFVLIFIQIAGGVQPPGSVRVATAQSVADAQNEN